MTIKEINIYQALLSKGYLTEPELSDFIYEIEVADIETRARLKAERITERVVYGCGPDYEGGFRKRKKRPTGGTEAV